MGRVREHEDAVNFLIAGVQRQDLKLRRSQKPSSCIFYGLGFSILGLFSRIASTIPNSRACCAVHATYQLGIG
jgi:hypothetical protein